MAPRSSCELAELRWRLVADGSVRLTAKSATFAGLAATFDKALAKRHGAFAFIPKAK